MSNGANITIVWGVCEVEVGEDRVEDTPVNYVYVVRALAAANRLVPSR